VVSPSREQVEQILKMIEEQEVEREEETESRQQCCVCLARWSTVAFVPCGHLCLCGGCQACEGSMEAIT